MPQRFRLGLVVNPVAGLGGRVGLKGTDGFADQALALGARPLSSARTLRALGRFGDRRGEIAVMAGAGALGQAVLGEAGIICDVVTEPAAERTTAADTMAAARAMLAAPVDLILFAGGDGTARDIFSMVGERVPMLGIPTGVKMQSAVFATSPEAAGDIVAAVARSERDNLQYRPSEIMDIDEEALRNGVLSPRLFGYALVPALPRLLQNAKIRNHGLADAALDQAARQIAFSMESGVLYAIGPGHTAKRILQALGHSGSLLGTDLVLDRQVVAGDVGERAILEAAAERPLRIVVGVIGGQGYVFGRGNQELSPAVIRLAMGEPAGRAGLIIIASQQKLLALDDRRLLVDSGDRALDRQLEGYWRVTVGPQEDMVMKLEAP